MSTAPSLARIHLRNLRRNVTSCTTCPFHTARPRRSAWPAGSAGAEEDDADPPRSSTSQPHASTSHSPSSANRSSSPRNRAGPAMEDSPPPAATSTSILHHLASSSTEAASDKGKNKASNQTAPSRLPPPPRRKTLAYLAKMKRERIPIACLTAYDYPTGLAIRSADVDLCLVGDSLANVALGHSTTQPLSLDAMIHHSQAVQRGLNSAILLAQTSTPAAPLVFADMPFGTFVASDESAVDNVIRLMQATGVDGVKIEGAEEVLPLIRRLTSFGIPVMGHLGLQPQRVGATSGYRVQGKSAIQAREIFESAKRLQEAGCFAIVLECIPNRLARYVSERLEVITIGIGAGSGTDGQILVVSDMMGELTSPAHILAGLDDRAALHGQQPPHEQPPLPSQAASAMSPIPMPHPQTPSPPKFVRSFVQPYSLGAMRMAAVQGYVEAVRVGSFPDDDREGYKLKSDEWRAFMELVEGGSGSVAE